MAGCLVVTLDLVIRYTELGNKQKILMGWERGSLLECRNGDIYCEIMRDGDKTVTVVRELIVNPSIYF
jgi:hypothetical protein